jgi:hypothetical protein
MAPPGKVEIVTWALFAAEASLLALDTCRPSERPNSISDERLVLFRARTNTDVPGANREIATIAEVAVAPEPIIKLTFICAVFA